MSGRSSATSLRTHRLVLILLSSWLVACGGGPGAPEETVDKAEIQAMLEEYLPVLGGAYAQQDTSSLEPWAVPKERARIDARIEELSAQGQVFEPVFESVTVEDVSVWGYANAFVTTLEVWDVSAYTEGSHLLINQSLDQRSRVKYQLKRKDDGWVILYRELGETFDS